MRVGRTHDVGLIVVRSNWAAQAQLQATAAAESNDTMLSRFGSVLARAVRFDSLPVPISSCMVLGRSTQGIWLNFSSPTRRAGSELHTALVARRSFVITSHR